MTRWLSYGNDPNGTGANNDKGFLRRREISFTLEDDIYIRYQSFRDMDDMKEQVIKKKVRTCPCPCRCAQGEQPH
jgi:DNA primase small subunit